MTTIDILQEKREDVMEVARRHGVTSIRVFGSVARGDESTESDNVYLQHILDSALPSGFLDYHMVSAI